MTEILPNAFAGVPEIAEARLTPLTLEEELQQRFETERLSSLAAAYMERGTFGDIRELAAGKDTVMGIVHATDPEFADLGKAPETVVFAERFKRSLSEVYEEYEAYDEHSTFLIALDVSDPNQPKAAGSIRIIEDTDPQGLKSIKDFVADDLDPEVNPWREELGEMLFAEGETYSPEVAWQRLQQRTGEQIVAGASHDVATLAVLPEYAGANGSFDGMSIRLYNTCLSYALSRGIQNLISIQDVRPFAILQGYGSPFDTFDGVQPHPYGGPYDTIPAYCVLERGMARIRQSDEMVGKVFIDGMMMEDDTLLIQHQNPAVYSAQSTGLAPTAEAA